MIRRYKAIWNIVKSQLEAKDIIKVFQEVLKKQQCSNLYRHESALDRLSCTFIKGLMMMI